ncbi:MAG: cytochrome c biogenesis protein CcsA [Saprospiraceae bacterium]|nr:MAG: cytochrome c assembly protein [Bacteroidetes bacterium OLB9]MCO6464432.1 cytochrome c biogenesis protein CcsA [Saprospiraceae bacterium]
MNIKGWWWKILGVLIYLYVIIGGLTVPLKPGVLKVDPASANTGTKLELNITGYNTHFSDATENKAWLKTDSGHSIKARDIHIVDDMHAQLIFELPEVLPPGEKVQPLTLIMDNEKDGAFVQPNAIFVKAKENTTSGTEGWDEADFGHIHTADGIAFPYRNILHETIRNTFFHVALWFAMFIMLIVGLVYAVRYLRTHDYSYDIKSSAYNKTGILFGILGLATGSIWARFTWNTFWTGDVKLNMTAVTLLIYLAYLVLRGASSDTDKKAKISSAYTIFAFVAMIPLLFIIPRMTDSLHPGNGGNPALGGEDLDNTLRMFFYPAILGLSLIGVWISTLVIRYEMLKERLFQNQK